MYGGVVQNSSNAGGDTSGYIPLAGTLPTLPVTGAIKFNDDVKIQSQDQPLNFFAVSTPGEAMAFSSNNDINMTAGGDGFGQLHFKTADNACHLYLQSGTGGILGVDINQIVWQVNDTLGKTSTMIMNPAFASIAVVGTSSALILTSDEDISINATHNLIMIGGYPTGQLKIAHSDSNAQIVMLNDGYLELTALSDTAHVQLNAISTALETAYVNIYPNDFHVLVDDAAGTTASMEMISGVTTFINAFTSGNSSMFSISDNLFQVEMTGISGIVTSLNLQDFFIGLNSGATSISLSANDGLNPGNVGIGVPNATASNTTNFDFNIQGLFLTTLGTGFGIKSGVNAKANVTSLVAGTKVVANTSVTTQSKITLTAQNNGTGGHGVLRVSSLTAGVGFTITSTDATENSSIYYEITEIQ